MNPLRSIRSSAFGRWAISSLGAGYIVLAHATTRWTIVGEENRARIVGGEGRWIVGLWHGRIMALPPEKTSRFPCYAIVSANKDGEIIAATLRRFGIGALRGSSWDRKKNRDKGGREAFDAAAALLQECENMVIALPARDRDAVGGDWRAGHPARLVDPAGKEFAKLGPDAAVLAVQPRCEDIR